MSVTVDMTITERQFNQLRSLIESRFGIQLPEEKRSLLQARLQKMVRASGMDNFADYYDSRLRNPELRVLSELVDNISTNHTYFWRENAHFTWFRDTWIPAAMQRHQRDRDLRVWCAAASTGQEPYTIAALLRDAVSVRPEPWTAGLLATDISQRVLDFARKGSYERDDVERLPGELVSRHFEADGPGRMKVRNKTRQDVTYRRLNLLSPSLPFTRPFGAIFLRNVMIYFDRPTKQQLLCRLARHLEPDGVVFIGMSESMQGLQVPFRLVRPGLYRRTA